MGDQVRNFVGRASFQDQGASQGVERLRQAMLAAALANKDVSAAAKQLTSDLKSLTSDEESARASASQLEASHKQLNLAKERRRQATQELKAALASLSDEERVATGSADVLRVATTDVGDASDRAASRVARLNRELLEAGRAMGGLQGAVANLAGGGGAAALVQIGQQLLQFAGDAVEAYRELELEIINVSTLVPEMDDSKILAQIQRLSTEVPKTSEELAAGLYDIQSSLDITADKGVELLGKLSRGAVAARTDTATYVSAIIGQMNAYGATLQDVDHIQDLFFSTVAKGIIDGRQLAVGLGHVVPAAVQMGQSMETLSALIVGVTRSGGNAATNITNLQNLLSKLSTADAQAELERLGIKLTDSNGEFRQIVEWLPEVKAKLEGMTESARNAATMELFPDIQARSGFVTLLNQADVVVTSYTSNLTEAGAAEAAYTKIVSASGSEKELAVNKQTVAVQNLGKALEPIAGLWTDSSAAGLQFLADFATAVHQSGQDFRGNWDRMWRSSEEAAEQGVSANEEAMRRLVDSHGSYLNAMEGNASASGDRMGEIGGDSGSSYADHMAAELRAGSSDIEAAIDSNLGVMDVQGEAGDTGLSIGSTYSEEKAAGIAALRPEIRAQINKNLALLQAGLVEAWAVANQYPGVTKGLGAKDLDLPNPNAVSALQAAGQAGLRGAQQSPSVRRQAESNIRSVLSDFGSDIEGGTNRLSDDERRAERDSKRRGSATDKLARDAEAAANRIERAEDRVQAAYDRLARADRQVRDAQEAVQGHQQQQAINAAATSEAAAREKLAGVTAFYRSEVEKLTNQEQILAHQQKAATAADTALLKQRQSALEGRRMQDEARLHSLRNDLRDTTLAIQEMRDAGRDALAPLEASAKRAAKALTDIQEQAAATREATQQSLWPLQDAMYSLDQEAKRTLAPYDAQLQSIGDRLYELAQAERSALEPLDARVASQQRIVDGHQAEADAINLKLEALRQTAATYDRLKGLQDQGSNIQNLRARLGGADLNAQERVGLQRQLAEAQKQYAFGSQENQLIGQQERANERSRLAQEELKSRQDERNAKAQEFASRRELLQLEQAHVERARELESRTIEERRAAIQADIDKINRDQELTDRKFHLLELQAQQDLKNANKAVEDEQESQAQKLKPLEDQLTAQEKLFEQYGHNAAEADRTATLEIGAIQRRIAAVNEDYDNRRERVREDIALLKGHQTEAEKLAGKEVEAAAAITKGLQAAYDKWQDVIKSRGVYESLDDALKGRQKAESELAEARQDLATAIDKSKTAASLAAPEMTNLATKTGTAATNTGTFATSLNTELNPALSTLATSTGPALDGVLAEYQRIFGPLDQGGAINALVFGKEIGFFAKFEERLRMTLDWERHEIWMASMELLRTGVAGKLTDIGNTAEPAAKGVGDKIGGGMAAGITASTPAIVKAAEDAVDAAIGAAKKRAEIASPSKRAEREIGAPLGMGAVVGLLGTRSDMVRAAHGLVDAAMSVQPVWADRVAFTRGSATAYAPNPPSAYAPVSRGGAAPTFTGDVSFNFPNITKVPETPLEALPLVKMIKEAWVMESYLEGTE